MPTELQYIDFVISIIGLILTVCTLVTSLNVKRRLIKRVEIQIFRDRQKDILDKIDGFLCSINEDKLHIKDNKQTFQSKLLQFSVEMQSSYSFLSRNSKKKIDNIRDLLVKQTLYNKDWENIATELVALKSYLQKEII